MQNYLTEEHEEVNNFERKLLFQLRSKMHLRIKSNFRNMHLDIICDGCRISESTTQHTLECQYLLKQNELVTYIPRYKDLYESNVNEQVYVARLLQHNIGRLPYI